MTINGDVNIFMSEDQAEMFIDRILQTKYGYFDHSNEYRPNPIEYENEDYNPRGDWKYNDDKNKEDFK